MLTEAIIVDTVLATIEEDANVCNISILIVKMSLQNNMIIN